MTDLTNALFQDSRTGEFYIVPVDPADFMVCESCE